MQLKRQRPPPAASEGDDGRGTTPSKRPRLSRPPIGRRAGPDLLSALSDELLVRILSLLSLPHLLAVAPVSRRLHSLAADSQLWKALYYARFVLPRAMRIPGFRAARDASSGGGGGAVGGGASGGHKLHYSGRRALWADGRRGGLVARESAGGQGGEGLWGRDAQHDRVNWKRQYKLRHNWARGKCAVEELRIGGETADAHEGRKMLVKVVEGVAITADRASGLRAWDLKTREILAHASLGNSGGGEDSAPSCLAIDDRELDDMAISIAVGFLDGSFGVWRLDIKGGQLERQYRHRKSMNGEIIGMAFSYPYLLTATESVLVSLYTFEIPGDGLDGGPDLGEGTQRGPRQRSEKALPESLGGVEGPKTDKESTSQTGEDVLPAPYLLTSLESRTSRPPLALSIRKTGTTTTIASIAYTFSTRQGWSIGLQDLHIKHRSTKLKAAPDITTTRLAYTTPIDSGLSPSYRNPSPPATPPRRHGQTPVNPDSSRTSPSSSPSTSPQPLPTPTPTPTPTNRSEPGPTNLCYTHPYLLATLPDNTLVLHLCTSTASSLNVSPGIRLWGHTSGISDAEITARGKAVSVSSRGEEMRVWELEGGRSAAGSGGGGGGDGGVGAGRSVEIRPGGGGYQSSSPLTRADDGGGEAGDGYGYGYGWDERRNWVGFDDEMVIVLKERKGGGESLMVYDFT
ncbi:hypothetical protein QBC33DRAFT_561364 [Phialemonium atrogriseum]|uniref:F-box domain-containing protein n=1 Tax=Phialemonium atrogriseum TaxID=1093897 RepID=A0AAJ0BV70_9PEZI|nr:uncharacterized protein QBC33DRAFT_561364 [Phialemonium atrogriseum]KAK1765080.1 hypothetical protein QBC33DRAFT_561364 [Phialemonium atrogriseum]